MISFIASFWPQIMAAIMGVVVFISRLQVKNAKNEARVSKENEKVAKEVSEAHKAISEAVITGQAKADKLLEKAHEKDSVSDLTNDSY